MEVRSEQMIDSADCAPEAALVYLEAAIRIMDSCSTPADIAAHADLAKAKLEDWLGSAEIPSLAPAGFERAAREGMIEH